MRTSYRDIFLLACCQGLLLCNGAGLISMNALVGHSLTEVEALSSLGATTYVMGSAVATIPFSMWMVRVGRRAGFLAGASINIVGCGAAVAALWLRSFPLYCIATAIIGVYAAIGAQYRFAAAEVAAPEDRARAISLVLAGGILGGLFGPAIVGWTRDAFDLPFLGSFVALACIAAVALGFQSAVRVPPPIRDTAGEGARPLREIARQPAFVVAVIAVSLGYGLMNLLMVATPLAMGKCHHPFSDAAIVIEWHVVAMYAPGFATGGLIKRFGVIRIISAGAVLVAGCAAVALSGVSMPHFFVALILLGVGWNFLFIGGTALLVESYRPAEKARAQGANDFAMFCVMSISSFSSGALVSSAGWRWMNAGAFGGVACILAAALWLWRQRRHGGRPAD